MADEIKINPTDKVVEVVKMVNEIQQKANDNIQNNKKPEAKKDYCNVPHSVLNNKLDDVMNRVKALEQLIINERTIHSQDLEKINNTLNELRKPWYKRS